MKRSTALLLALGIILAIVADSTDFFFHRPYYEYWDLGANSLCVNRAKHFAQLYGCYSRFGWHHPGPVCFYVWAFGEWLFHDVLHLSPAPYNGQVLANLIVTASFFVAALSVFSHWVSVPARRWFVTGALVLGAMHFGAVSRMPSFDMLLGSSVFTSAWTGHIWVFPFLCLLAAGASVAAGRGEELPLLALADGFLIHTHISAPLFVGPISLLAYGGLLIRSNARERAAEEPAARWRPRWRMLGSAWRAYPRIHIATVAILTVFALPLVADLFRGDASNFHAVLMHMRTHHGKHKTFIRALFYFVQFGAYRSYRPHFHYFGFFDAHGAYAYLWYHKKIYAAWIVGVLLLIWTSAVRPALVSWRRRRNGEAALPVEAAAPGRTRFAVMAGMILTVSILLTLYWGIMQDGDMMYYSAWIDFAIYYFGLLIVLTELASVIASGVSSLQNGASAARPVWRWAERLVPVAAVVLACGLEARRFRVADATPELTRTMHESFVRIVRDAKTRNPTGIKMLNLPVYTWELVTGLVLEMEREGQPLMILSYYTIPFPDDTIWHPTTRAEQEKMEIWHFLVGQKYRLFHSGMPKWFDPFTALLKTQLASSDQTVPLKDGSLAYPLLDDVQMRVVIPVVDPGAPQGASIDMRENLGHPANWPYLRAKHEGDRSGIGEVNYFPGSAVSGFSDPEDWGSWNSGTAATFRLRGQSVDPSETVEITLDAHPFLDPGHALTSQRMNLALNGTPLGAAMRLKKDGEIVYTVPGELWNRALGGRAGGALEFGFPDAISPVVLGHDGNADPRQMGVGLRSIRFRTVSAAAAVQSPALGLNGPGSEAEIVFKPGGNARTYATDGWFATEPWGTWTDGHTSELRFHSPLIDGTREVEITLDIHAVMDTGSGIKGQRLRVKLGDETVDRERFIEAGGSLVLTVPAATWNGAVANNAEAVLRLEMPDAISPARIDPAGAETDNRPLGLGIERIRFRNVPAPVVGQR